MDDSGLLQEDIKNKLRYELYLSKYPDEQLIKSYKEHVASLLKDEGANNKDIFPLKKHTNRNLLYGCVRFDQNIEEEWFIIYLLYELSKYDKDLVIRAYDSDGDILLIEAADHLPQWLESSKSKNRVFIHKGHLHIIPENINLKELLNNYQLFSSSSPPVTVTQVSAQYIREMNRLGHSKTAPLNNYSQTDVEGGNSSSSGGSCSSSSGSQDNQNYFRNLEKVDTLANSTIQNAIRKQLTGMPDKKAWLSKKFKQLDDIISDKVVDDAKNLNEKFRESLSLAAVMAMNDDDLKISPISTAPSSVASSLSASSSSSWMSEQQND